MRRTLGVELLSRSEMGFLFPGSAIWAERFVGLPKSLIAVKRVSPWSGQYGQSG